MLITFANGFNNKILSVPLNWLQKVLIYEQEKTLKSDLSYYNIEATSEGVVFNKSSIDLNKPLVSCFFFGFKFAFFLISVIFLLDAKFSS